MQDKFRETEKITCRAAKIKVLQLSKESQAEIACRTTNKAERETHNQDILNQSNNDGCE